MATRQPVFTLQWSPDFSVGVERFDAQHEKYFLIVQKLYDAIRFRAPRARVGEILGELYAYSVSHMTDEEDVLEEYGFPRLQEHRAEHRKFRRNVRSYMDEFDAGNTAIAVSVFQFLQDWLHTHLSEMDGRYTEFLHARGVK